ncbi:MAG TPA: GDSL-type esterase/lipase family protein [Polyangium sp.]|nr:GDSL-type esterase/lipase family protein [Polyangium sp.]
MLDSQHHFSHRSSAAKVSLPHSLARLMLWLVVPMHIVVCQASAPRDSPLPEPEADAGTMVAPDAGDAADGSEMNDDAGIDAMVVDSGEPFDAGPDPCGEVLQFGPVFPDIVARWSTQDALGGWPHDPVVFVGSSSIRRWENLARTYSDYSPLQRGLGGAQLGEVAYYAHDLVGRHNPRAIVLYAGTNDVDAGVAPNVVVDRFRCFRYRIGQELGWTRPIVFLGLTPNPARWNQWPNARAVNEAIAGIAALDPAVHYVDVATPFLATGSPPSSTLFVADQLHLSAAGYALWNEALRPVVESVTSPTPIAGPANPALPAGTRVLVDFGPSNPDDGEMTPSPDYLGQHWNNWHAIDGGLGVLPGEQLVDLVTTSGAATGIDLVIAGGFSGNGRANGGLVWPDGAKLGNLAVGSATGDFFYTDGPDQPGALFLRGLDPAKSYTLRLFAAREDLEVRVTRYTITGASSVTDTLQTTGPGAGAAGANTNDDTIVVFQNVKPDAWGHLFIDVAIESGAYGYLSLVELMVE